MSDSKRPTLVSDDRQIKRIIQTMSMVIQNAPTVRLGLNSSTVIEGTLAGVDGEDNGLENGAWAFGCTITVETHDGDRVRVDALDIEFVDKAA